ncbi:hypothetical protein NliqN6_1887 [Naganishia liquefaciens]|uniref:cAMP-dependent protein kinase regulatory subunit n=1 Tax=Naganishia liquefaciens TaxID=104408 RepID=A0A8H3TRV9_9TREE|nr:hypothetical protein NliqN6_1887 [Naganishia liquefaciens]
MVDPFPSPLISFHSIPATHHWTRESYERTATHQPQTTPSTEPTLPSDLVHPKPDIQSMPASQLQALLSDLTEEFQTRQTTDVLQFCADWFQAKLKAERSQMLASAAPTTSSTATSTPSAPAAATRKFPNFPAGAMTLPAVPGNVFHAHLTQPSPFSEHIPSDSPFGHGSTSSSTLAQRRATFAGPSFGNSLVAGGDAVGGSAPEGVAGGQLDQVREEEEDDPMTSTARVQDTFAAFSFSGSPAGDSLEPEGSPFEEVPSTSVPASRYPPQAASAGKALVSADLLVPSYALGRRTSVSAESLVPTSAPVGGASGLPPIMDADTTPTLGSTASQSLPQKSEEQLDRIKQSISNNLLFRNLDEEQERDVLAAMREVHVDAGHVVIEQGAAGDYFYVVEDGQFDIYVKKAGDGDVVTISEAQDDMESKWGKKVHTAVPGGSFGELALMYNAPRSATVVAQTKGTLWALDRISFRTILLDHTSRKRRMYETFLAIVPILASLEPHERAKIADALESRTYQNGENVVTEGEVGETFFLIESGTAEVEKAGAGVVGELGKGDYFGELALLNRAPRAATVRAAGGEGAKLRVAALGEKAFTRLLGPVREIMARSAGERYGVVPA